MNPMILLPSRRGSFAALVCVTALVTGFLIGWPEPAPPAVHAAACQFAHPGCVGGTMTSVLEVNHATTANPADPVLPNDSEDWTITANWTPAGAGNCTAHAEVATATVAWNGSGWTVNNVNLTANIVDIDICDAGSCSGGPYSPSPSRRYRLRVDINDPVLVGMVQHNLLNVVYATTAVDNGQIVTNSSCGTGSSVTPTTQVFTATDTGAFECSFACNAISGPLLTLTYQ